MTTHDLTPHTPGWAHTLIRPQAQRIIDRDTYVTEIDLNPIAYAILTDLGRALHRIHATWRLRALATLAQGSAEYQRQVTHLCSDPGVQNALRILLTPEMADGLQSDLLEATDEPGICEYGGCSDYAIDGGGGYCGTHDEHTNAVSDRVTRGASA